MTLKICTASLLGLLLALASHANSAAPENTETQSTEVTSQPYLSINVGVETAGLEQNANNMVAATDKLAESIHQLAANPELSPEQQLQLSHTLEKVGQISESIQKTVIALPEVIADSRPPIMSGIEMAGNEIASTLFWLGAIFITLIALLLWLFYLWILKPVQAAIVTTSSNISILSESLQHTAKLVDEIQKRTLAEQQALKTNEDTAAIVQQAEK